MCVVGAVSSHSTSMLTPGLTYKFCVDTDGVAVKKAMGDSTFDIYVSPLTNPIGSLNTAKFPGPQQQIILADMSHVSPSTLQTSNNSLVYLALECDPQVSRGCTR